jgi:transcriptional regulator NrdR
LPFCAHDNSQVKDSRPAEDNTAIRRRRQCENCGGRFTTFERVQLREVFVIKSGDASDAPSPRAFRPHQDRAFGIAGRKRGIAQERLDQLVSGIQRQIETMGESEVASHTIGEMVMEGCANWTAWPISASPRSTATFPRPVISRNLPAMSATSEPLTDAPHKPVIVLVRPQLGENIGKAARAMLNFGLTELRLVSPRDGWPNPSAGPAAAGADVVLEKAQVFETLAEAVGDCAHVYATTVRKRGVTKPVLTPRKPRAKSTPTPLRPMPRGPQRHRLRPRAFGAGNRRCGAGPRDHHRADQPGVRLAQSGAGGDPVRL